MPISKTKVVDVVDKMIKSFPKYLKDSPENQKALIIREYDLVRKKLLNESDKGKNFFTLEGILSPKIREILEDSGLTVELRKHKDSCECWNLENCNYHPQNITIIAWDPFELSDNRFPKINSQR